MFDCRGGFDCGGDDCKSLFPLLIQQGQACMAMWRLATRGVDWKGKFDYRGESIEEGQKQELGSYCPCYAARASMYALGASCSERVVIVWC